MTRRLQFSLKWLFLAVLIVATFFGGIAIGRKHEERRLQAERTATSEVIGKLLQSHTEALQAAERRIADLERQAVQRKTDSRMPTLRPSAAGMPTLRESQAVKE